MTPFSPPTALNNFIEQYPEAHKIYDVAKNGGIKVRNALVRLWLSEGIPYAFKKNPALYEEIRVWIATKSNVDPKEISITGSARIGQSLAPAKLGKKFDENSDLDLFIISEDLFNRLRKDFNTWSFNFETERTKPANIRQEQFWKDTLTRGQSYFSRGFFDAKLIPAYKEYTCSYTIANTMWLLKEKLNITSDAPKISEASIRCYRFWGDFTRQVSINLAQ